MHQTRFVVSAGHEYVTCLISGGSRCNGAEQRCTVPNCPAPATAAAAASGPAAALEAGQTSLPPWEMLFTVPTARRLNWCASHWLTLC